MLLGGVYSPAMTEIYSHGRLNESPVCFMLIANILNIFDKNT